MDELAAPVVLFAQGVDAGVPRGAANSVGWSASTRASSTASGRGRSTAGPANSTHPRFAAKEIEGRGQKVRTDAARQMGVVSETGRIYLAGKRRKTAAASSFSGEQPWRPGGDLS